MNQSIAFGLIFAAIVDLFVAFFVLAPRLPPQPRMIITVVMAGSAAVMIGLAVGLLSGLIQFG